MKIAGKNLLHTSLSIYIMLFNGRAKIVKKDA